MSNDDSGTTGNGAGPPAAVTSSHVVPVDLNAPGSSGSGANTPDTAVSGTTAPAADASGAGHPSSPNGGSVQTGPDTAPRGTAPIVYYDDASVDTSAGFYRLDYHRAKGSPSPTPAIRALQQQIEDVERLVNVLFSGGKHDLANKTRFFHELHLTAASGFIGDDYDLSIGIDNLQTVKNHIADAYPQVRGPIWRINLLLLLGCLVATGVASLIHFKIAGSWVPVLEGKDKTVEGLLWAVFLVPTGCAAGLFCEFLFRVNDDIPYEQLRAINPGRWNPGIRAMNTIVVAFVLTFLLAGDILQVGVSGTLLNDFKKGQPYLALAIGFVTGFAFPYVRDLFQQVRPERRIVGP